MINERLLNSKNAYVNEILDYVKLDKGNNPHNVVRAITLFKQNKDNMPKNEAQDLVVLLEEKRKQAYAKIGNSKPAPTTIPAQKKVKHNRRKAGSTTAKIVLAISGVVAFLGVAKVLYDQQKTIQQLKKNSITTPTDADLTNVNQVVETQTKTEGIIEVSDDTAVINNLVTLLNEGGPNGLDVSADKMFDTWLWANNEAVMTNSSLQNKEYRARLNYLVADEQKFVDDMTLVFNNMAVTVPRMVDSGMTTHYSDIFNATESRYNVTRKFEGLLNDVLKAAKDNDKNKFDELKTQIVDMVGGANFSQTELDPQSYLFMLELLTHTTAYTQTAYGENYILLDPMQVDILVDVKDDCKSQLKDLKDRAYAESNGKSFADTLRSEATIMKDKATREEIIELIDRQMQKSTYRSIEDLTGVDPDKLDARGYFDENGKFIPVTGGFSGGGVPGGGKEQPLGTWITDPVVTESYNEIDPTAPTDVLVNQKDTPEKLPDNINQNDIDKNNQNTTKPTAPEYNPDEGKDSADSLSKPEQPTGKYSFNGVNYNTKEEMEAAAADYYAGHNGSLDDLDQANQDALDNTNDQINNSNSAAKSSTSDDVTLAPASTEPAPETSATNKVLAATAAVLNEVAQEATEQVITVSYGSEEDTLVSQEIVSGPVLTLK